MTSNKMSSVSRELRVDPTYSALPHKIDEALLESRVRRLRAGDLSVAHDITIQLMRPVMGLVQNHCAGADDEPIGVALLELVEAVERASTQLKNDDIKTYIFANIYRRITERKRALFGPRPRTLRKKQKPLDSTDDTSELTAKQIYPSLEFVETLQQSIEDDREEAIVHLRSQEYTMEEIAERVKTDASTVSRLLKRVHGRYQRLTQES